MSNAIEEVTIDLGQPKAFQGPSTYLPQKRKPYGDWFLATIDGSPMPKPFYTLRACHTLDVLVQEAKKIINASEHYLMPKVG